MIDILADNPLLLLFLVAAIGYAIGQIKIKGSSLGVAAVLFVGLAAGALDPRLALPEIIVQLGLVLFVYTLGLSSGPGFFASFKRDGLRNNLMVFGALAIAALVAAGLSLALALKPAIAAGIFAGSLTNTPALAAVLETVRTRAPAELLEEMSAEPVVGYSVAYPIGVLGVILAVWLMQTRWKVDYAKESDRLRQFHLVEQQIYNRTVCVTRPEVLGVPLDELARRHGWQVVFGRLERAGQMSLAGEKTELAQGDLVSVIGTPEDVDLAIDDLGEPAAVRLEMDRSQYDYRRIFVSNPQLAGRRLADLNLAQQYGAIVTRVRQGDIDLLAGKNTVLELGDRVRVVAQRERLKELSELFGDSYRALSEINLLSLGLGITLGLIIGLIPIPLPGGLTLSLGNAGGPLVVALILGTLRRTGPVLWTLPYNANLTLRQMGLILLLAGIGVRSGYTFFATFAQSGGLLIFAAGALVTMATAFLLLFIGRKALKIPYPLLTGMVAGVHTQPAVLGFALEQAKNEAPNLGYALVFPTATIMKILLAQLVYLLLTRGAG